VHLFLDICQGLGLGAAAGIRPFLPALVTGGFAAANWGVDFDHTDYSFLESPVWLGAVVVLMVLTVLLRRDAEGGPTDAALGGIGVGLGALFFAGTLADHGHTGWGATLPALLGGAAAAALAQAATRGLTARVGRRLDAAARRALPVYFEAVGLLLAALSIALPPVSLLALPFLAWLLAGGRRREGGKYAGLRILR
jgi:hypothetical protein